MKQILTINIFYNNYKKKNRCSIHSGNKHEYSTVMFYVYISLVRSRTNEGIQICGSCFFPCHMFTPNNSPIVILFSYFLSNRLMKFDTKVAVTHIVLCMYDVFFSQAICFCQNACYFIFLLSWYVIIYSIYYIHNNELVQKLVYFVFHITYFYTRWTYPTMSY